MDNHSIAKFAKEKGNMAFKPGDYATARSLFSHAMAFDPSNHIYPLNRSQANLKLERWDEAEADATNALDLCPRNLKALLRRGRARKKLGKWDEARIDIQMFIDIDGDPTLAGAEELKAISDAESSPPTETSSCTSGGLEIDLSNLHLQDNSDSSFFSVHTSAFQKGKGAFASRDIQKGVLVLSERPIFCVPTYAPEPLWRISIEAAVRKLSPAHLDSYLSLHNSHNKCSCFRGPLLGIFGTNAFTVFDDDSGICLKASRFNHSCSPNAWYSFNPNTGDLQIFAMGTIARGEEISVSYIGCRRLFGSPRRSRQANLHSRYHFTCACSVCSLPEAKSKISDVRRRKVDELWEIAGSFSITMEDRLNVVIEAMRLLREEGYMDDVDDFLNEAGPM